MRLQPRDFVKRTADLGLSLVALCVLAFPMLVIGWRIRCDGAGLALFGHERVGRDGVPFRCWKFRTMYADAQATLKRWQETNDPLWHAFVAGNHKLENDPRVTPLGRWLRATSLDELPQLWNVLRGEMSLVGPRPVTAAELEQYGPEGRQAYLKLRPGLSGLWQVSGRSSTTFEERVALDIRYERERSLVMDLRILLQTIRVVLSRRGAH